MFTAWKEAYLDKTLDVQMPFIAWKCYIPTVLDSQFLISILTKEVTSPCFPKWPIWLVWQIIHMCPSCLFCHYPHICKRSLLRKNMNINSINISCLKVIIVNSCLILGKKNVFGKTSEVFVFLSATGGMCHCQLTGWAPAGEQRQGLCLKSRPILLLYAVHIHHKSLCKKAGCCLAGSVTMMKPSHYCFMQIWLKIKLFII